MNTFLIRWTVR